jgi:hypothetical protein
VLRELEEEIKALEAFWPVEGRLATIMSPRGSVPHDPAVMPDEGHA